MDRKLETMFDLVPIKTSAITLDSTELKTMLEQQRTITMKRVSDWLKSNAMIFELDGETSIAIEVQSLGIDLQHLSEIDHT